MLGVALAGAAALAPSPLAAARFEGLTPREAQLVRTLARHAPPQGRRVLRVLAPTAVPGRRPSSVAWWASTSRCRAAGTRVSASSAATVSAATIEPSPPSAVP